MLRAGRSWIVGMQRSTSKEIITTIFTKFPATRLTHNVKTCESET